MEVGIISSLVLLGEGILSIQLPSEFVEFYSSKYIIWRNPAFEISRIG